MAEKKNYEMVIGSAKLDDGTTVVNLGNRDLRINGVKIPPSRFFLFKRIKAEGKGVRGNFFVKRQSLETNMELLDRLETFKEQEAIFVSSRDEVVLQLSQHIDIYWIQFIAGEPVLVEYVPEKEKAV